MIAKLCLRSVWSLLCLLGVVSAAPAAAATSRPNILYILADDMGIGDVSCLNSNSVWKTPNLDRLAREGRIFTDAHSASGVCTPSRYSLMTGRYSWRGRLKTGVLHGYDPALIEKGRVTVASFLRQQGYATAMVGKWHLGLDWQKTGPKLEEVDYTKPFSGGPLAHGFDSFFGISASLDMPPYVYLENDRATTVPVDKVADSPKPKMWRAGPIGGDFRHDEVHPRFIERSLSFINARAKAGDGKPFFLYLALASPHTPIVPTAKFEGKTRTNPYGDFVAQVDADIGTLLDALARNGQATNTLVIFTADNGFAPAANLPELQKLGHEPSAGFRGHKADLFEGGHRVPFIARWPGQVSAGTRCTQTVGHLDLLATCADLLGAKLPEQAGEDSVSILPLLRGGNTPPAGREALVHHSVNGSFAIRQGKWKLLLVPDSGGWSAPKPGSAESKGLPKFQLYDLELDPAEKVNLQAEHPEIVQRLGRLLRSVLERGRSTPGAAQPYDSETPWLQKAWTAEFDR
ncbi:MAG: arylsulfatase [Verrucomicrobia bacterium]|nr:arylsulfatase [Verrucomicrobiota bacterium]